MIGRHQSAASLRWLAASGVMVVILDILLTIGLAAQDPQYSHSRQFISELGEDGRPGAALFNAWSIVWGLLFAGFSLAVGRALHSRLVLGACLTIAVSSVVTALFPCDPGCAGETPAARIHMLSGYVSAPAIILAPAFACYAMKSTAEWRGYRAFSMACAVLLAAGSCWLAVCHLGGLERGRCAVGMAQRVIVGVLYVWVVAVSVRLWQLAGKRSSENG